MRISIVGAGPASLMAATQFIHSNHEVTIYEQKKTAGRKFLVAGKGGFNLTHIGEISDFISHFSHERIRKIIPHFTNQHFIDWLTSIGIPTYEGTSGKIFPISQIKPYQVLDKWLDYLKKGGIKFEFNCKMVDFSNDSITLQTNNGIRTVDSDKIIIGLGGNSWSKTGSDANWLNCFNAKKIDLVPFKAANCGIHTDLPASFFNKWNGISIKNIAISVSNKIKKGEIRITSYGFEGGLIYYFIPELRSHEAVFKIDFKPSFSISKIEEILLSEKSSTVGLRKLHVPLAVIELIKQRLTKEQFLDKLVLSNFIKNFLVCCVSVRPIEEAISVAGGVAWNELARDFSLKKYPNIYIVGEMLDWEAPTGGYLIHGAVASGFCVGQRLLFR